MAKIGIQQTKKFIDIPAFRFESGVWLNNLQVCYETWGELNAAGDNTIFIAHSLTGTSHAAKSTADEEPGWWEAMIGPGKPFDTDRYFVICSNVLGGCSGSSGPSSLNPETALPYATDFPTVTIRDMVRAQKQLLDWLGVRRLRTVSGGSMGGMQALEWAALYPEMVDSIIPIAAPGRAYPQSIAYRKAQRKAIMMDPHWNGGFYYHNGAPKTGIELARLIGFITYRTEREFAERFGRNFIDEEPWSLTGRFEIEQYLEHHGQKLADWFDANTYLYLSKAMDLHDLGRGFASYESGVLRIQCPVLIIGFDSDLLFPCYQQKEIADILRPRNRQVYYREIHTIYGHDAFLLEIEQISETIREFFSTINL